MTDFSVYMTYVGNDTYQMFIRNNASETHFIRIITGYTEVLRGERIGRVSDSWIISPLGVNDEHVFIQSAHKRIMHGKRLWVAFEAVKRSKPRNIVVDSFLALSPAVSKWRTTIGSSTQLDIQAINSVRSLK